MRPQNAKDEELFWVCLALGEEGRQALLRRWRAAQILSGLDERRMFVTRMAPSASPIILGREDADGSGE